MVDCSTRVGSTVNVTRRTGEKIESTGITPMVVVRLVAVGRHVAAALLDGEVDGEAALGVERGDVEVGVEDLDVGGRSGCRPAVTSAGPRTSRRSVTGSSDVAA